MDNHEDQFKRVCLAFGGVFRRKSLTQSLFGGEPVRLERDLYGITIALIIHSLDHSLFTRLIAPTVGMRRIT